MHHNDTKKPVASAVAHHHQDWESVTWVKNSSSAASASSSTPSSERRLAQRKLEAADGDDGFSHTTVTLCFSHALQKARLSKKLTQKQLASNINVKSSVINEYESGVAIPNQAVIAKLSRALGVQLPSATKNKNKNKKA